MCNHLHKHTHLPILKLLAVYIPHDSLQWLNLAMCHGHCSQVSTFVPNCLYSLTVFDGVCCPSIGHKITVVSASDQKVTDLQQSELVHAMKLNPELLLVMRKLPIYNKVN